jgi:hypothetical protein
MHRRPELGAILTLPPAMVLDVILLTLCVLHDELLFLALARSGAPSLKLQARGSSASRSLPHLNSHRLLSWLVLSLAVSRRQAGPFLRQLHAYVLLCLDSATHCLVLLPLALLFLDHEYKMTARPFHRLSIVLRWSSVLCRYGAGGCVSRYDFPRISPYWVLHLAVRIR